MSPLICVNRRPTLAYIHKNYNETHAHFISTLRNKNDTDMARYNFDVHQPILIIFGRNVAEEVSYKKTYFPPHLTNAAAIQHSIAQFCILSEPPQRRLIRGSSYEVVGTSCTKKFPGALRRKIGPSL